MGFNEKVHAFIAAKYYVHLTEAFGERGKKAFVHATQYYAQQRGRRMAQRAIRDGKELTYETYCQYGEWVNTQEVMDMGCSNQAQVQILSPDLVTYIYKCPWHTQFQEMGLIEGGDTYCADLDKSICQGFNPHIVYEVDQTLHKSPYCIHRVRNSGLTPQSDRSKKMEYVHSFEYHCAHSYWSYSEVSRAIFGQEGAVVAQKVMEDFEQTYGKEMADALRGYEHTNFNVAD